MVRADYRTPEVNDVVRYRYGAAETALLKNRISEFGFTMAEVPGECAPQTEIERLGKALGLGEPYVAALYQRGDTRAHGALYTDVRSRAHNTHPGFGTTEGQTIHVDGLLEPIGTIRTTILFCVRPAVSGGRTVLFNSSAAFETLRHSDPAAAESLRDPGVLRRRSTLPNVDAGHTGPAFAYDNGLLITRYSEGPTVEWNAPPGRSAELERALNFLRAAAEDKRYSIALRLGAGEALIFRNDVISHGREAYRDDPAAPRHLIRTLYLESP
uniref:Putative dioxygenase n=1 Tax=Streptomyces sp. NRRL 30471 TaxID=996287 RepID=F2WUC8_9ACTN|nr:putative dioxygenase [Streptomyces sp. NRRL 30471]